MLAVPESLHKYIFATWTLQGAHDCVRALQHVGSILTQT